MKKVFACLLSAMIFGAALCGCGQMDGGMATATPAVTPGTSPYVSPTISPMISPDIEDGIIEDRDGIIDERDTGGKGTDSGVTRTSPSPATGAGN